MPRPSPDALAGPTRGAEETVGGRLRRLWRAAREVAWGLAVFDTYHEVKLEAQRHQDAFDLLILGEMIGIPLMNTTVGLRLLPYALGGLEHFRERFLREPEVLDQAPHIH
jgi:hypothetical protein